MGTRLLIVALLLAALPVSAAEELPGPFAADVVRVIDGDTFLARVHLWLGLALSTRVRIRGIDAPELKGADARAKPKPPWPPATISQASLPAARSC